MEFFNKDPDKVHALRLVNLTWEASTLRLSAWFVPSCRLHADPDVATGSEHDAFQRDVSLSASLGPGLYLCADQDVGSVGSWLAPLRRHREEEGSAGLGHVPVTLCPCCSRHGGASGRGRRGSEPGLDSGRASGLTFPWDLGTFVLWPH